MGRLGPESRWWGRGGGAAGRGGISGDRAHAVPPTPAAPSTPAAEPPGCVLVTEEDTAPHQAWTGWKAGEKSLSRKAAPGLWPAQRGTTLESPPVSVRPRRGSHWRFSTTSHSVCPPNARTLGNVWRHVGVTLSVCGGSHRRPEGGGQGCG